MVGHSIKRNRTLFNLTKVKLLLEVILDTKDSTDESGDISKHRVVSLTKTANTTKHYLTYVVHCFIKGLHGGLNHLRDQLGHTHLHQHTQRVRCKHTGIIQYHSDQRTGTTIGCLLKILLNKFTVRLEVKSTTRED